MPMAIRPAAGRSGAGSAARAAAVLACAILPWLSACGGGTTGADPDDEGQLLVDGYVTIDDFHFSRAACDEVLPDRFPAIDTIPAGTAASLEVTAIACYAVDVRVEDTLGREVAAFRRFFDIPGREDGDKERGVIGYVAWDGRDAAGNPVPAGPYLWRLDFRFGEGRSVKFRAAMRL